jgi:hypothetical protein
MSSDLVEVNELIAVDFHYGSGGRKGRGAISGVFSREEEVKDLILL